MFFVRLPFRRFHKASFLRSILTISILLLLGGISSSAKAANIVLGNGGDLQAALNAAQCGDSVILDANASFTAPQDGMVARARCTASNPITVRTANVGNLPAGRRVGASDASNMARIVTPGPYAALTFAGGAQGWKFIGIDITTWANIDSQHYVSTLIDISRYVAPAP